MKKAIILAGLLLAGCAANEKTPSGCITGTVRSMWCDRGDCQLAIEADDRETVTNYSVLGVPPVWPGQRFTIYYYQDWQETNRIHVTMAKRLKS